ncbi:MAG: transporter substrate-binding domain-containing protein [Candidatus Thiodiazotropha endolucinida]|nr:transporter substrate-binding domain-containing protein [Candidatus Thiodiazotropha endolucinida]
MQIGEYQTVLYRFLGLCLLGVTISTQGMAQAPRFSPAEKAWLTEHQFLRVGVAEMTPPILYFERSQSRGLVPDYMRALADRLGLQLQIRHYPDQGTLLKALREGEVDLIGALVHTDTAAPDLHYSRPYLNLPAAIFTTDRIVDKGLTALDGLEVSVVAGSVWEEGIPHLLPSLNVMAFNDLGQALKAVIADRAQAYLGDTASVNHLLATTEGYDELKEMMRLDMTVDVAVATLFSEPVLQSLLQKGLDRLSTEDMHDIWYNWQGLEAPVKQGGNLVTIIVWGFFLALWSLFLAWAVRLHEKKALTHHRSKTRRSIKRLRRRENLLKQKLLNLKHKTKRYRHRAKALRQQVDFISEVLPSCSWSWDPSDEICQWDDEMFHMAGQERGAFTPDPASILNLVHEQDRKNIAQLFDSGNRDEIRLSYRLLLADGGERRVLDYSHFVPGDTEDSGKRVGICWDVGHFFSSGGDLLHVSGAGDSSIVVETVE